MIITLFGILRRFDSMAETCGGLRATGGKPKNPGLGKAPAKSTAGYGLRNRWIRIYLKHLFFTGMML
jgi:hypothetical protein